MRSSVLAALLLLGMNNNKASCLTFVSTPYCSFCLNCSVGYKRLMLFLRPPCIQFSIVSTSRHFSKADFWLRDELLNIASDFRAFLWLKSFSVLADQAYQGLCIRCYVGESVRRTAPGIAYECNNTVCPCSFWLLRLLVCLDLVNMQHLYADNYGMWQEFLYHGRMLAMEFWRSMLLFNCVTLSRQA